MKIIRKANVDYFSFGKRLTCAWANGYKMSGGWSDLYSFSMSGSMRLFRSINWSSWGHKTKVSMSFPWTRWQFVVLNYL